MTYPPERRSALAAEIRDELTARAILRTLLACGDNEEKQLRFLAMMLRQMQDKAELEGATWR